LLPGKLHDRNDFFSFTPQAGLTLALLDAAFATLPMIDLADNFTSSPRFGELALWHPLVPDPFVAVEQLCIDKSQSRQICTFLTSVLDSVDDLYNRLPQQLLHRDYDPGNILMDDQRVTAVLDFEIAGWDIRVLDLCVALSWWPVNLMGTGKEWAIIDAFGNAYVKHFPLSEDELLAIPDVLRLRDAASFVYRMGRYFAGLETDARMQGRVKHSLWREAWLSANRERLLQYTLAWYRS
jgi:Ser/Thr protein kinase RdoA (MazF antagonist)